MTAINRRTCHEIQNMKFSVVFPQEFRPLIMAVAALDQHKGYKGPPLTGTIRLF